MPSARDLVNGRLNARVMMAAINVPGRGVLEGASHVDAKHMPPRTPLSISCKQVNDGGLFASHLSGIGYRHVIIYTRVDASLRWTDIETP